MIILNLLIIDINMLHSSSSKISKHPFWTATTGSQLIFRLDKPPDSQLSSMVITVYTISEPYTYQIKLIMENEKVDKIVYHKKKDAIKIIKEDWIRYYENRTKLEFVEHKLVEVITESTYDCDSSRSETPRIETPRMESPMSDSESDTGLNSPRRLTKLVMPIPLNFRSGMGKSDTESPYDSCPPTPSPRSIRRNGFRNMLNEFHKRRVKSSSGSTSSEISPKSSPRKIWMRKLSLPLKEISSGESSPSGNESERGQNIDSQNTDKLLKQVSLKLSIQHSQKCNDNSTNILNNFNTPNTPRNSESVITF